MGITSKCHVQTQWLISIRPVQHDFWNHVAKNSKLKHHAAPCQEGKSTINELIFNGNIIDINGGFLIYFNFDCHVSLPEGKYQCISILAIQLVHGCVIVYDDLHTIKQKILGVFAWHLHCNKKLYLATVDVELQLNQLQMNGLTWAQWNQWKQPQNFTRMDNDGH